MKLICPSSQVLLSIINKPIYLSAVAGTNGGRSVGALEPTEDNFPSLLWLQPV